MLTAMFRDIRTGRLKRLPYLGYSILLAVLGVVIAIGIGAAIGAAENLVGGDIQLAQEQLMEQLGVPAIILIVTFGLTLIFANFNLMAKRIRDFGLPGWWTVLGFVVLSGAVSAAVSEQASSGLSMLLWIALLVIPSDLISGK